MTLIYQGFFKEVLSGATYPREITCLGFIFGNPGKFFPGFFYISLWMFLQRLVRVAVFFRIDVFFRILSKSFLHPGSRNKHLALVFGFVGSRLGVDIHTTNGSLTHLISFLGR